MPRRNTFLLMALGGAIGSAAVAAYVRYLRPRMLTWGALTEELFLELPGDDLVPAPRLECTHAININTQSYRVWPWLVQMGQGRGGFYTYDWLENMAGLNIRSADRVLAIYQDLKVGDTIPLAPGGFGPKVAILEENRALVLHGDTRLDTSVEALKMRPGDYMAISWAFYLYDIGDGVTRLVERWKADWNPSPLNNIFFRAFLEPAAFIMERGMLQGIKDRAEGKVVWETAGADSQPTSDTLSHEMGA